MENEIAREESVLKVDGEDTQGRGQTFEICHYMGERKARINWCLKGMPKEFGLVFADGVDTSVMLASTTSCAYRFVNGSKPIYALQRFISYSKTPNNPNSDKPSLIPEFIRFAKIVKLAVRNEYPAMIGCLCVLGNFHKDPDALDFIRECVGDARSATFMFDLAAIAKEILIDVTCRTARDGLSMLAHYGCDDETRQKIVSSYAKAIWKAEGCPEGNAERHWHEAERKVDAVLAMTGDIEVFFKILAEECWEQTQRNWR